MADAVPQVGLATPLSFVRVWVMLIARTIARHPFTETSGSALVPGAEFRKKPDLWPNVSPTSESSGSLAGCQVGRGAATR